MTECSACDILNTAPRNHGPELVLARRRRAAIITLPLPSLRLLRGAGRWVSAVEQHGGARPSSRAFERLGSRPRPQLVHLVVVELRPPGGRGEAPGLGADPADLREHPRDGPGSGGGVSDRAARTHSEGAHLNVEIVWSVFSRHVTWAPAERYVTCPGPFRFSEHRAALPLRVNMAHQFRRRRDRRCHLQALERAELRPFVLSEVPNARHVVP